MKRQEAGMIILVAISYYVFIYMLLLYYIMYERYLYVLFRPRGLDCERWLGCRPILKTAINNEYVHDSCLLPIICFYFEASKPYLCSFNVPSFLLSDYCVRWVNDK